MGAFIVRLTRTRIRFAYFFWITLKPRFGTFEAPSFMVIPMWLLTEALVWVFAQSASFQIWPYIGGLAAGILCALIFRATDFERRVLGREPAVELEPEDLPLVAFQVPRVAKDAKDAKEGAPPGTGE
jgi:membrane associated rhomboid family serine protease